MQKVVINSNLNPSLKLFFYSSILTNNNLLLKIYYEILQQYFSIMIFYFLYYFSSFHFIFIHSRFISFLLFSFFLFLAFLLHHTNVQTPFFYFLFHLKNIPVTHLLHIREREREGYSSAAPPLVEIEVAERTKPVEIGVHHVTLPHLPPHCCSSSSLPPSWVRSTFFFFFIFACFDSTLF